MDGNDPNDPGDPRNKQRTRESQQQLRRHLLDWDPIGVGDVPEAHDEYDCMISPLMHLLHDGASAERVQRWLSKEIEEHFGLGSAPEDEAAMAHRLVEWWQGRLREPN